MAASDYVPTFFKKPLALGGASTDEYVAKGAPWRHRWCDFRFSNGPGKEFLIDMPITPFSPQMKLRGSLANPWSQQRGTEQKDDDAAK